MELKGKTFGVACLTAASLLLLSGLWCIFFSPVEVYGPDIPNTVWQRRIHKPLFQSNSTETFNFTVQEAIYVRVWIQNVEFTAYRFYSVVIHDQQGNKVYERYTDSNLPFDFVPNKTGNYMLEICNQPYVNTSLTVEMMGYYPFSRPLTSTGQLLILVSAPFYGFAVAIITGRKRTVEAAILTSATILLLSGVWCIRLSPVAYVFPPELGDVNAAWVKNFPAMNFEPNGVANYTIVADDGQYVQVQIHNLWFTEYRMMKYVVFNSRGDVVIEDSPAFGNSRFGFLSRTREKYTLSVYNQPDVATQLTVEVVGYNAMSRPLTSMGIFLMLISLPLYGFGIWLAAKRGK